MMMVADPVCGMEIMPELAVVETIHNNQMYYFCSEECFECFEDDPDRYVSMQQPEAVSI